MINTLIFGGTTEGRQAVLDEPDAVVCVTTAYAGSLLPPGTDCRIGRLDLDGMRALMTELRPRRVLDATHPFALQVHDNIAACCSELGIPLVRIERPEDREAAWRKHVLTVRDAKEAASLLSHMEGPVFLTTGSHTLSVYTETVSPDRLYVRVLPTAQSLTLCEQAGIHPSHIIAMQGPFSAELNAALYDDLHIQTLVTKDSGAAGGITEKVLPALARNMDVILIERPQAAAADGNNLNPETGGQHAR
ncbi:MAG: precorrin-6A reductase [Clostridia bacterium]|nr:precorrin-6A reductase [Clostridia bacterium]MBQ9011016.1 precorrin-6A reductase [Clostridia bacterium]